MSKQPLKKLTPPQTNRFIKVLQADVTRWSEYLQQPMPAGTPAMNFAAADYVLGSARAAVCALELACRPAYTWTDNAQEALSAAYYEAYPSAARPRKKKGKPVDEAQIMLELGY